MTLSIYSFTMPAQKEGLYALPPVSVTIGNKVYHSSMSSYTVEAGKQPEASPSAPPSTPVPQPQESTPTTTPPTSAQTAAAEPQLRLEAGIDGKDTLYPGQRTHLIYRYFFSGNIGLTLEELPLLDAEGFIKIGEKEINDSVQGGLSVRVISQQVEARTPGKFSFGPSKIEGVAYKEDTLGRPVATSEKLTSVAPAVTVTVQPFPEKNKPASFNGAVGNFEFKTALQSPSEMNVGDEITLLLEISGQGNLKNVTVPELCCQPGMSGFFRLNDLPPSEEIIGDKKNIVVKFKPLNTQPKAIPALEFSFFDPETSQYTVLHSEPIAISVKPGSQSIQIPKETPAPDESKPDQSKPVPEMKISTTPPLLEIEGIIPLSKRDLYNKPFGSWWTLLFIPLAIMMIIYQSHLKEYLDWQKSQVPVETSEVFFSKAFSNKSQGKLNIENLKQSFKMALVESKVIPSAEISDKELPDEGIGKDVKDYLHLLDEKYFAGNGAYNIEEIFQSSQTLMGKIRNAGMTS
jgi:hypothetical protein